MRIDTSPTLLFVDFDAYEVLRNTDGIEELDPRELAEGMILIGNREAVGQLIRDFDASIATGEPKNFVVDAILEQAHPLKIVVHNWQGGEPEPGAHCSFFMVPGDGSGLREVRVLMPYGQPVLVRRPSESAPESP